MKPEKLGYRIQPWLLNWAITISTSTKCRLEALPAISKPGMYIPDIRCTLLVIFAMIPEQ